MQVYSKNVAGLTKNQTVVLKTLKKVPGTTLTAYEILDQLRDQGLKAPLQIYRALDKLIEKGLVHRLESLNAFIACDESCQNDGATAFVICDECDGVQEVSDVSVASFLGQLARQTSLKPTKSNIELHGICHICEKT